ncbi:MULTISPECIES: YopX family protein [Listeria]|uniref:YopX protein domain-containing protein n=1 Tax=Listeria monocytogenes serotype 4a (strain M7) TaxID=1030009 RepID=A0A0E0URR3_LISMM|nr:MULTISPECIES: YopX family protein [Listeria]ACK40918.1 conserved hypothetical protein [Listeria monocytogenes HCC23]AEH91087.1 conserved hypothetical protein [Listeria monocytogenes M7]EAC6859820.1 hypothetical protein [Listeria monocytogenes]EAD0182452.1 hypothetical protein [Listeria monocytogenes]EAD5177831.1 hypothetical protein [Listeria monocytogenes]
MRGIEYRVWDKEVEEMDNNPSVIEMWQTKPINEQFRLEAEEKLVWMQYIGLKDKNGKKIFEGDIVINSKGQIGYIAYLIQEAGFVVVLETSDYRLGHRNTNESYAVASRHEVIGNMQDNPELFPGWWK